MFAFVPRLVAICVFTLLLTGKAHATADAMHVSNAWARATVGEAHVTAVYMDIANRSAVADKLVSVTTPLAESAQLHESKAEGGVMEMRPVASIGIEAGEVWRAKPGGYHFMVVGLHAPLKVADTLPLVLHFERAGNISVDARVLPLSSSGPKQ